MYGLVQAGYFALSGRSACARVGAVLLPLPQAGETDVARRATDLRTGSRPMHAAQLFFRHSREGGNPAEGGFEVTFLDSRLRGNDEVYIEVVINNLFFGEVPG